jgi:tripartite-type tricarboxylate transporter receptor subunit TctC
LAPLLSGHALPFDPSKFHYLGSANSDDYLCVVRSDAPVKSFQEALSRPLIMGTTAPGSKSHDLPRMLSNIVGAKFQIVSGYAGTLEVSLAIEKGEVQGMCGLSWSTLSAQHPDWLKRGVVRVLVQEDLEGHPELNKMGVPLAINFARTEEDRRIMELFYSQSVFGRPFVAPEGIPPDRLAALRTAFLSALHDERLLADAAKMGLDISAQPGNDIQTLVAKLYGFPPNIIERAKQSVANKPPI